MSLASVKTHRRRVFSIQLKILRVPSLQSMLINTPVRGNKMTREMWPSLNNSEMGAHILGCTVRGVE